MNTPYQIYIKLRYIHFQTCIHLHIHTHTLTYIGTQIHNTPTSHMYCIVYVKNKFISHWNIFIDANTIEWSAKQIYFTECDKRLRYSPLFCKYKLCIFVYFIAWNLLMSHKFNESKWVKNEINWSFSVCKNVNDCKWYHICSDVQYTWDIKWVWNLARKFE